MQQALITALEEKLNLSAPWDEIMPSTQIILQSIGNESENKKGALDAFPEFKSLFVGLLNNLRQDKQIQAIFIDKAFLLLLKALSLSEDNLFKATLFLCRGELIMLQPSVTFDNQLSALDDYQIGYGAGDKTLQAQAKTALDGLEAKVLTSYFSRRKDVLVGKLHRLNQSVEHANTAPAYFDEIMCWLDILRIGGQTTLACHWITELIECCSKPVTRDYNKKLVEVTTAIAQNLLPLNHNKSFWQAHREQLTQYRAILENGLKVASASAHQAFNHSIQNFTAGLWQLAARLSGLEEDCACLISLGSLSRYALCAYSDLECALLVKDDVLVNWEAKTPHAGRDTLKQTWELFEFFIRSLGETGKGLQLDNNSQPRMEPDLRATPARMAERLTANEINKDDGLVYSLLHARYLAGNKALYENYQQALKEKLKQPLTAIPTHQVFALAQFKRNQTRFKERDISDLKKSYQKYLTFLVLDLALYHHLPDADLDTALNALTQLQLLTQGLAKKIRLYDAALQEQRSLRHLKNQQQDDAADQDNPAQKALLEELATSLLEPYYNTLLPRLSHPGDEGVFAEAFWQFQLKTFYLKPLSFEGISVLCLNRQESYSGKLPADLTHKVFTSQGKLRKDKALTAEGSTTVFLDEGYCLKLITPLENESPKEALTTFLVREYAVSTLSHLLGFNVVPPGCIVKICLQQQTHYGWLTQELPGETLLYAEKHPELLKQLDAESYSALFCLSLLCYPEDGQPRNFKLVPRQGKLALVSIDNKRCFINPLHTISSLFWESQQVICKTALYLLPFYEQSMATKVTQQLVRIDPAAIAKTFREALVHLDKLFFTHIPELPLTLDNQRIQLPPLTSYWLQLRLQQLQQLFSSNASIAHTQCLKQLEPALAKHYANLRASQPIKIFYQCFPDAYKINPQGLGVSLSKVAFINSNRSSPKGIQQQLVPLLEPFYEALDFSQRHPEEQHQLLELITGMRLTRLSLKGCALLTEARLLALLKLTGNDLIYLDITNCYNVTEAVFRDISYYCKNLETLKVGDNFHLKQLNWAAKLPKLKTLNLERCQYLHKVAITQAPSLLYMYVTGCFQINVAEAEKYATALCRQGDDNAKRNQYIEAIQDYEAALALNVKNAPPLYKRLQELQIEGLKKDAQGTLAQLLVTKSEATVDKLLEWLNLDLEERAQQKITEALIMKPELTAGMLLKLLQKEELRWAIEQKRAEILAKINKNANLETKDASGNTPLLLAALYGHEFTVRLLLEASANIEAKDNEGNTPLLLATRNGRESTVKTLLEAKANIEAKDNEGYTPLLLAVWNGHEPIMKALLEANANIKAKENNHGYTSLLLAAWKGHESTVKVLLKANADIEAKENNHGYTPLLLAAYSGHASTVKALLEANANIEAKDNEGDTPLLLAASNGHEPTVKALLETNANIEAKSNYGNTPLLLAARNAHESTVKALLEANANIEAKNNDGNTPLLLAVRDGRESIVKVLLEANANIEAKNNDGSTPLLLAAWKGHNSIMKVLLEANANIEAKSNYGNTPLLLAAYNGHESTVKVLLKANADIEAKNNEMDTPLLLAAWNGHESAVKALLEANVNIEAKDNYGYTPLLLAAIRCYESIISLLLKAGAKIEGKDMYGNTPLILSSYCQAYQYTRWSNDYWTDAYKRRQESTVKLLIAHKANVNAVNNRQETALYLAASEGSENIVKLLIDAQANIEGSYTFPQAHQPYFPPLTGAAKGHVAVSKLLIHAGANPNNIDRYCCAPLYYAVEHAHDALIALLLEAKADINTVGVSHDSLTIIQSPLHLAVQKQEESIIKQLITAKANLHSKDNYNRSLLHKSYFSTWLTQLLLDNKLNINAQDKFGNTPLHSAIFASKSTIIPLLLAADNININIKNKEGYTPLNYAVLHTHMEAIKLLLASKADSEIKDNQGRSPLHTATALLDADIIKLLIDAGADATTKDKEGENLLQTAIFSGFSKGYYDAEVVELLLRANPGLTRIPDKDGDTPLHLAAYAARKTYCHFYSLLDISDINAKNNQNQNVLHILASQNNIELVQWVVTRKVDVNAKDINNYTPLYLAIEAGNIDIVKLLIEYDVDINQPATKEEKLPLFLAMANINGPNNKVYFDIVKVLVEANANLNLKDKTGKTGWQLAFEIGNQELLVWLLAEKSHNYLKIPIDNEGNTLLLLAAKNGLTDRVEELVKQGADLYYKNHNQQTALMLTVQHGHLVTAAFLEQMSEKPLQYQQIKNLGKNTQSERAETLANKPEANAANLLGCPQIKELDRYDQRKKPDSECLAQSNQNSPVAYEQNKNIHFTLFEKLEIKSPPNNDRNEQIFANNDNGKKTTYG